MGGGSYVAAEVRAAAVAVVDVAVGGVGEGAVEVMAGTLSVELSGAVSQVKLLDNSEHVVVCYNAPRVQGCPQKNGASCSVLVGSAGERQRMCSSLRCCSRCYGCH
jgi:hypothetical protein